MDSYQDLQTYPTYSQDPVVSSVLGVLYLVFLVFYVICAWKIYVKAGKPGWAAIIPLYNLYVFLQIIGRPGWWLLLYFIPLVNIVISLINAMDLAKVFGKSSLFGIGLLWLLSFIGYPILAFGKSTYKGGSKTATPTKPSAPPAVTPAAPAA